MNSKHAMLRLTGITHMMGAKDLFEDVNMEIVGGQVVGLIGPNGVGKSTLLKIMAGLIDPRAGSVEVEGERGIVTQGLNVDLGVSVYEYIQLSREKDGRGPLEEREVLVALNTNGGKDIDIHKPLASLSGGERTTVRITQCLLDSVDILLLDEPTNHLDRDGIALLQSVVKKFRGPVVIVSHDRQFLDDVCTDIYDLRWGNIEQYEGTYTQYIKERTIRTNNQTKEREEQQEEKQKAEESLELLQNRAAFRGSTSIGKTVRARKKFFDRRFVDGKIEAVLEDPVMNMEVDGGEHEEKELLTLGKGIVGRTDTSVTKDAMDGGDSHSIYLDHDRYQLLEGQKKKMFEISDYLHLYGNDRVVIAGKNGSGKTTLLKILRESYEGASNYDLIRRGEAISIGWFDQHDESLSVDIRVMKRCLDTFPAGRDQAMITEKLGGANIPEEDLTKKMSDLSHGQRMKIRFLQLMLHPYDLLILDEPTNHLDIATREELEVMLQNYKGGLLIVSHDRWFVEKIGVQTKRRIRDEHMEVLPWKKKHSDKGK